MLADLRTLRNLIFSPRHRDPKQWLDAFYRPQAKHYDRFRQRLLSGRRELIEDLSLSAGETWIDVGGGTGANLEWMPGLETLKKVVIVDLCEPLLEIARERVRKNRWTNVELVHADALDFLPPTETADAITFSYSLTMMPNWLRTLNHYRNLLKIGGKIGVVDFTISQKKATGHQHNWLERRFWPTWFERDNVCLNPAHLDLLKTQYSTEVLEERYGKVPYLPGMRVPYYRFIGVKES